MESALLQMLIARGGPLSSACLRWVIDGGGATVRSPDRVDVRVSASGDPTPF
jgi:hypothetical protein